MWCAISPIGRPGYRLTRACGRTSDAATARRSYASTQLSPGTRLNGIYEIDQLIAAGGMGEIYKGHTIQTGDPVAIKVMLPEFAENDAALALFRKEASALHNLHHEAIVRYYVFTIEPVLRPSVSRDGIRRRAVACRTHPPRSR